MKFNLVDRILELVPGERITTCKALTLSEEYLADHFPTFPVMPGVLMLECMAQSAAWLVRATQQFSNSLFYLRQAKNVIYKNFVPPGQLLTMNVECKDLDPHRSEFVGRGTCANREMVKARITLGHVRLSDGDIRLKDVDDELIAHAREQYSLISQQQDALPANGRFDQRGHI